MDFLKQIIEEKRRASVEVGLLPLSSDGSNGSTKKKQYLRRAEVEKIRATKKRSAEEDAYDPRGTKHSQRASLSSSMSGSVSLTNGIDIDPDMTEAEAASIRLYLSLSKDQVIRRLRKHREVVTYFGESDEQRALRLKQVEEERGEMVEGTRNEFLHAFLDADELITNTLDEQNTETDAHDLEDENIITMDRIHEKFATNDYDFIRFFFRRLLNEWEAELDSKPDKVKRSQEGRTERARFRILREDLKPLMKSLKKHNLQEDIFGSLLQITQHLSKREYVEAHDAYYSLAIGNAPWPMGVTMVGIHERSGREKIESRHVAHVLNDETQRKYIQAVKRIMTYCQNAYPSDPSRMVKN